MSIIGFFLSSFEIVKPLGRVEVVPSPYVTESTRIAVLLPVFEDQLDTGMDFVRLYEKICMKNQDNTFLMIVSYYFYFLRGSFEVRLG